MILMWHLVILDKSWPRIDGDLPPFGGSPPQGPHGD